MLDRNFGGYRFGGWGDPAGDHAGQTVEDTPIQMLDAAGIPCKPAPSNEPTLRRAAIARPATRMASDGKPALLVSPKCEILRKGLAGGFCYRRMKLSGDERHHDVPQKNSSSHVVETLDVTDIEAECGRLQELGMTFGGRGPIDLGHVESLYGRDPEGNLVEIQQTRRKCGFPLEALEQDDRR